jgi:hypothetical protein
VTDADLAAQLLHLADQLEVGNGGTTPVGIVRVAARRLVELSPQDVERSTEADRPGAPGGGSEGRTAA